MMAAVIIDHLYQITHSNNTPICFIAIKAQTDQSAIDLLTVVLKQLLKGRPDIAASTTRIRDQRESNPSPDELMQVLALNCSLYSTIYIVVDASDSQLKVRANKEDVKCFVAGQLHRNYHPASKRVRTSKMMFLLAALLIDSLRDQTSPKKVRAKLAKSPKGSEALNDAYKNELDRIERQSPGHRLLAKRTLSWITYAQRLLTVEELRHALAIEPGESSLDYENIDDLEDIVSVCAGLIVVDKESSIVCFVHYTIQEYFKYILLEQNPNVQEDIAIACLTYLLFDTFQSGSCSNIMNFKQRLSENPFFDYSARYWSKHIRPVQCSQSASTLVHTFLHNRSTVNSVVQATSAAQYKINLTSGLHLTAGAVPLQKIPLYYAALRDCKQIVMLLIDEGADVNAFARHSRYGTALHATSVRGYEQVVKLPLEMGADVDAFTQSGDYQIVLIAASSRGYEQIVKLLLAKGANIYVRVGELLRDKRAV
ncbi:hypothetical protein EV356DRAFT_545321 [Viridothelium virens]|uniref:Uncharacterized protein n=1 Tax=Viridothelium virens TaxID=1048519 RepID=A0A6A6H9F7_VIRVR|nr:hypothetical protein EV356DRAFT_545321 [Viridothelium virens]